MDQLIFKGRLIDLERKIPATLGERKKPCSKQWREKSSEKRSLKKFQNWEKNILQLPSHPFKIKWSTPK